MFIRPLNLELFFIIFLLTMFTNTLIQGSSEINIRKNNDKSFLKKLNNNNKKIMNIFNTHVIKRPLISTHRILNIEVFANRNKFQLIVDAYPSYESNTSMTGCDLFVVHPDNSRIMLHRHFHSELHLQGESLAATLKRVQPGRLLLITVAPGNSSYMAAAEHQMHKLGSMFARRLAVGEMLIVAIYKNSVKEILIRKRIGKENENIFGTYTSVHMPILVLAKQKQRCEWYRNEISKRKAAFCESYEAMMELCQCNEPLSIPNNENNFDIPLIILSTSDSSLLIKTISQVRYLNNLDKITILIVIFSRDHTSIIVAELLNIKYIIISEPKIIENQIPMLKKKRLQQAALAVEKYFPKSDYFIFVETATIMAKDILSFFVHYYLQMRTSPTECITAYNPNSLQSLAHDPTVMYHGQMYPQLGFLVSRSWLDELADQEYELNQTSLMDSKITSNCVYPQVSRIAPDVESTHEATDYESYIRYTDKYVINSASNVKLGKLNSELNYWENIVNDLIEGEVVPENCSCHCIKHEKYSSKPRIVYINYSAPKYKLEFKSLDYLFACLSIELFDTSVQFHGVVSISYHDQPYQIVLCPSSPFCIYAPSKQYWEIKGNTEINVIAGKNMLLGRRVRIQRIRKSNFTMNTHLRLLDFSYAI